MSTEENTNLATENTADQSVPEENAPEHTSSSETHNITANQSQAVMESLTNSDEQVENPLSFVNDRMKNKMRTAFDYASGDSNTLTGFQVYKAMQCCGLHPTHSDRKNISDMVITKYGGQMSYDDFESFIAKDVNEKIKWEKDVLRDSFKKFDKNGDGFVSLKELKSVLCGVGEVIMEDEYDEHFKVFDKNKDGRLDVEEFVGLMYNLDEDDDYM